MGLCVKPCCGCNIIHDACCSANIYTVVGTATVGIWIGGAILAFGRPGSGNYGWYLGVDNAFGAPAGTFFTGGSYASGDLLQLTVHRSGSSCSACSGGFINEGFGSWPATGWETNGGALGSWTTSGAGFSTSGGHLQADSASIARTIGKKCRSQSASYDWNICVNGSSIASGTSTFELAPASDQYLRAGVRWSGNGAGPPWAQWDNFKLDLTT